VRASTQRQLQHPKFIDTTSIASEHHGRFPYQGPTGRPVMVRNCATPFDSKGDRAAVQRGMSTNRRTGRAPDAAVGESKGIWGFGERSAPRGGRQVGTKKASDSDNSPAISRGWRCMTWTINGSSWAQSTDGPNPIAVNGVPNTRMQDTRLMAALNENLEPAANHQRPASRLTEKGTGATLVEGMGPAYRSARGSSQCIGHRR